MIPALLLIIALLLCWQLLAQGSQTLRRYSFVVVIAAVVALALVSHPDFLPETVSSVRAWVRWVAA